MLCFFVLLLGLKAFNRIKDINRNTVLGICGFAAILLFLFQKLEYDNVPDFACVWFSLIFLVIYARSKEFNYLKTVAMGFLRKKQRG